ncbi:MAG: outer membrane protein assembly factor BamD [Brumimicrobium sp.]|nr:outer membrane protein assembly factor BamD [Brumimicrobium sp.]
MFKLRYIPLLVFGLAVLFSCSDYQKVIKSDDYEEKANLADVLYDKESYTKAIALYEQVYQRFPQTGRGQLAYYRLAKSYYALKDYYMAGYYFENFTERYPSSDKVEECLFMTAICSVKNSPAPSLDQEETKIALNDFQIFVQRYPESNLVDSCNRVMDRLRFKLETKDFNSVQLYDKMENYRAALTSAKSFLEEYPQSSFKQEAGFIAVKNAYHLGMKSVFSKQKERLEEALELYAKYYPIFENKSYQNQALRYYDEIGEELLKVEEQYAFNEIVESYEKSNTQSKEKKMTYLKETLKRYDNFAKKYPESEFLNKAKSIKDKAEEDILKI